MSSSMEAQGEFSNPLSSQEQSAPATQAVAQGEVSSSSSLQQQSAEAIEAVAQDQAAHFSEMSRLRANSEMQLKALSDMSVSLENCVLKVGYIERRMDSGSSQMQDSLRHLMQRITEFRIQLSPTNVFRTWIRLENQGYFRSRLQLSCSEHDVAEGWTRLCEAAQGICKFEASAKVIRCMRQVNIGEMLQLECDQAMIEQTRLHQNISLHEFKAELSGVSVEKLPKGGMLVKIEAEFLAEEWKKARNHFIEMKNKYENLKESNKRLWAETAVQDLEEPSEPKQVLRRSFKQP